MLTCNLDMDGVIANMHQGIINAVGGHFGNGYTIEEMTGLKPSEVWPRVDFSKFPKMPDADAIVNRVIGFFGLDNVCICSNPRGDKAIGYDACGQKMRWLEEHYPQLADHYVFAYKKRLVSHKEGVLIDDWSVNVDKWKGKAFLLPRPWNERAAWHTLDSLDDFLRSLNRDR